MEFACGSFAASVVEKVGYMPVLVVWVSFDYCCGAESYPQNGQLWTLHLTAASVAASGRPQDWHLWILMNSFRSKLNATERSFSIVASSKPCLDLNNAARSSLSLARSRSSFADRPNMASSCGSTIRWMSSSSRSRGTNFFPNANSSTSIAFFLGVSKS